MTPQCVCVCVCERERWRETDSVESPSEKVSLHWFSEARWWRWSSSKNTDALIPYHSGNGCCRARPGAFFACFIFTAHRSHRHLFHLFRYAPNRRGVIIWLTFFIAIPIPYIHYPPHSCIVLHTITLCFAETNRPKEKDASAFSVLALYHASPSLNSTR